MRTSVPGFMPIAAHETGQEVDPSAAPQLVP